MEEVFVRLEAIVEEMYPSSVALDNVLKLYEEADGLLEICQSKLKEAEQKVETLVQQGPSCMKNTSNCSEKMERFPEGVIFKENFSD